MKKYIIIILGAILLSFGVCSAEEAKITRIIIEIPQDDQSGILSLLTKNSAKSRAEDEKFYSIVKQHLDPSLTLKGSVKTNPYLVIRVRFNAEGDLLELGIKESIVNEKFNDLALAAVGKSIPFRHKMGTNYTMIFTIFVRDEDGSVK